MLRGLRGDGPRCFEAIDVFAFLHHVEPVAGDHRQVFTIIPEQRLLALETRQLHAGVVGLMIAGRVAHERVLPP